MVLKILSLYRWQMMLKIRNCFQAKIKSQVLFEKAWSKDEMRVTVKSSVKFQNDQRWCLGSLRQITPFKEFKDLPHGSWVSQLNNRVCKTLLICPSAVSEAKSRSVAVGFSNGVNTSRIHLQSFKKNYLSRNPKSLNWKEQREYKGKGAVACPKF